MSQPIQNINGDFDHLLDDERYNDPNEYDEEDEEEFWQRGERRIDCHICYGVGCTFCNDLGYTIKNFRNYQ